MITLNEFLIAINRCDFDGQQPLVVMVNGEDFKVKSAANVNGQIRFELEEK